MRTRCAPVCFLPAAYASFFVPASLSSAVLDTVPLHLSRLDSPRHLGLARRTPSLSQPLRGASFLAASHSRLQTPLRLDKLSGTATVASHASSSHGSPCNLHALLLPLPFDIVQSTSSFPCQRNSFPSPRSFRACSDLSPVAIQMLSQSLSGAPDAVWCISSGPPPTNDPPRRRTRHDFPTCRSCSSLTTRAAGPHTSHS